MEIYECENGKFAVWGIVGGQMRELATNFITRIEAQGYIDALTFTPLSALRQPVHKTPAPRPLSSMTLRQHVVVQLTMADVAAQSLESGEWPNEAKDEHIRARITLWCRFADVLLEVEAETAKREPA